MTANNHLLNNGSFFSESNKKTDKELPVFFTDSKIAGSGRLISSIKLKAHKIALSDAPVLITGETGSGKDVFADFIQSSGNRRNKPYIKINCASIPEHLFETEFFGHIKGSFTDASKDRKGKFVSADTGTLFLDELFEMPINIQSRLLRVIENGEVYPVGSETPRKVDVRIIAATNRSIRDELNKGNFKKELLFRINVLNIEIPPLREHREDIPELVDYLLKKEGYSKTADKSAMDKLINYDWPGNIRELSNILHRAAASSGDIITSDDIIHTDFVNNKNSIIPLKKAVTNFKKNYIIKALKYNNWNQMKTADMLEIQRTYLSRLIRELDIFNNKE